MGSKREEERNEKIIRGLMKLPPNRRCINCNSLVPQYVCTNFWTFVCTTCSGIHREFTHRVKSVSMAKFTTQELEALQNGGNQRAREIYLKEWDAQNLRLPDNSKPDKIREFIKNVYVNKKYVGGKSSDNASSDVQNLSSHEDESRRASSYHSYSQSPPYDFQYEERRYGKRTSAALSRKPGSDRGLYEKHFSSFLSPGRPVDHRSPNHVIEDRFAIERSNSRASDCSVSSGAGDPFKSDIQSPNFQKDNASVVSSETSREFSSEDLNHLRNSNVDLFSMTDGGNMPHPQRAVSLPVSYGVPNNHLPPSKSIDSSALPSLSQSSPPMNFNGLDLFDAPFAPQVVTSTAPIINTSSFPDFPSKTPVDLFQPFTSNQVVTSTAPIINTSSFPDFPSKTPVDLFQPFTSNHVVTSNQVVTSTAPIINTSSFPDFPSKTPMDLFQPFTSNHVVTSNQVVTSTSPIISTSSFPEFPSKTPMDLFQPFASNHVAQAEPPSPTLFSEISNQSPSASFPEKSSDVVLLHPNEGWATFDFPQHAIGVEKSTTVNFPGDTNSIGNLEQWPPSTQHVPSHGPSSAILPIWHNDPQSIEAVPSIASTQVWNAFEDSNGHLQISQEFQEYGNESVSGASIPPMPSAASHSDIPLHDFSGIPGAGSHSFTFNHVSTNPFDIPYDPAVEFDNVPNLWDMSSLHEALPNGQMPTSFTPAANHQPWFSDDQIDPFCPTGSEGALEFIAGQGSNKQLMNGPSQEPVASVGGNPFA